MKVTLKQLRQLGACTEQVELFKETFGASVEITEAVVKEHGGKFGISWLAGKVLTPNQLANYKAKCAPLDADYAAKCDRLNADYKAKLDLWYADYAAKCDRLNADYWAELALFSADYTAKRDLWYADYKAKRDLSDADYWAERAPLDADYRARLAQIFWGVIK